MQKIDESKIENLCKDLGYKVNGILDLLFKPSFDKDRAVVKVVLKMEGTTRSSQLIIMETICKRAINHLSEAKRRLRELSIDLGIEIKIQEI